MSKVIDIHDPLYQPVRAEKPAPGLLPGLWQKIADPRPTTELSEEDQKVRALLYEFTEADRLENMLALLEIVEQDMRKLRRDSPDSHALRKADAHLAPLTRWLRTRQGLSAQELGELPF